MLSADPDFCGLDNPQPLQKICLDFICHNLDLVCYKTCINDENGQASKEAEEASKIDDEIHEDVDMDLNFALDQLHKKLEAKISQSESSRIHEKLHFTSHNSEDADFVCHAKLSEEILRRLSDLNKIDDLVLTLFDGRKTCLKKVRIENASKLTENGLANLSNHNITDLEVSNLVKATVNDLIQCLNAWTLDNLKSLNVSNSTFVNAQKHTIVVALLKLPNLTSLNVSGTEFNKTSLDMVMEDLHKLEHLDISNTKVRDISALLKAKNRLKSLSVAQLKLNGLPSLNSQVEILAQMEQLRHLDISDNKDNRNELFAFEADDKFKVSDFLEQCCRGLPYLVSLDLSGREISSIDLLIRFISHHPQLSFIGLMQNDLCLHPYFTNPAAAENHQNLVITGRANEQQVLEALRRYHHRPTFIQKALYHLFSLTQVRTL